LLICERKRQNVDPATTSHLWTSSTIHRPTREIRLPPTIPPLRRSHPVTPPCFHRTHHGPPPRPFPKETPSCTPTPPAHLRPRQHPRRPPPAAAAPFPGFLAPLGIYGFSALEDPLLAGLVTGDPVLLVGSHGSAKTLLAQRVAEALGLRFWAYDASKALFEELIGFPNPASIMSGEVDYARTPLSIQDKEFVLVDEISRASPSMQNKWLEIVRSRRVMGLSLPRLRHVFAAMNPPASYPGAIPLDPALAGRFAWILPVPELKHLGARDFSRVATHIGPDDAPLLPDRPTPVPEPDPGPDLRAFLAAARSRFPAAENAVGALVERWLAHLHAAFLAARIALDGRRAGMIYRNVLAFFAVRAAKGDAFPSDPAALALPLGLVLRASLPFAVIDEEVAEGAVTAAHGAAMKALTGSADERQAEACARLFADDDPRRMVRSYLEVASLLDGTQHQAVVTRLEEGLQHDREAAVVARHFVALHHLVRSLHAGRLRPPPDVAHRLLLIHRDAIRLDPPDSRRPYVTACIARSAFARTESCGSALRLAVNHLAHNGQPAHLMYGGPDVLPRLDQTLDEMRPEFTHLVADAMEEFRP